MSRTSIIVSSELTSRSRPGLAFIPVSDATPSRLVLAWRRDDPPEVATTPATFAARTRRPAHS